MKLYNPIKRWWNSLDAFDQEVWGSLIQAIVVMILVGGMLATIFYIINRVQENYTASRPCSDFANSTLENIPVRCLDDYGITIIHD